MKMLKKVVTMVLAVTFLLALFSGCENIAQNRRERTKTIVLEQDTNLYEKADGRSEQKGTLQASSEVEYSSTKKVDGVKWYETDQGWFSVFEQNDNDGHIVSNGYTKGNVELYSGAAASAAVVGTLDVGTCVDVYQVRDLWSLTDDGWVLSENLYVPGRMGENAGWCLTLKDGVRCFTEPNADSMCVKNYRTLYRMKLYEIIEINGTRWGYTDSGWIDLIDAYVEGETGEGACYVQVVDSTALNVRIGPGTGYTVLHTLPIKSYTDVLFQVYTDNNYWGFVGDGWIYMGLVKVVES